MWASMGRRALLLLLLGCPACDILFPFSRVDSTNRVDSSMVVDSPQSTVHVITVCATGCTTNEIQLAITTTAELPSLPAGKTGLAIEVRDSRTYERNLSIEPLASSMPLRLRAAAGTHPVISGTGGRNTSALTINAPQVTISGFMFRGYSQRAIFVGAAGVTIHHCAFTGDFSAVDPDQYYRGTGVLLIGAGTQDAHLYNNTFYGCEESLQIIDAPAPGNRVKLRNNIFVQLDRSASYSEPTWEPIIWFKPSRAHYQLSADYNLYYSPGPMGCLAWDQSLPEPVKVTTWRDSGLDVNSILASDPLFFAPAAPGYDFHVRSTGGRWNPSTKTFVNDSQKSPAIDAGDPASPVGGEPMPNAGRINQGCFGGTVEASRS